MAMFWPCTGCCGTTKRKLASICLVTGEQVCERLVINQLMWSVSERLLLEVQMQFRLFLGLDSWNSAHSNLCLVGNWFAFFTFPSQLVSLWSDCIGKTQSLGGQLFSCKHYHHPSLWLTGLYIFCHPLHLSYSKILWCKHTFFDDSQILSEVSINERIFFQTSGIIKQLEGGPLIRWPPCLLTWVPQSTNLLQILIGPAWISPAPNLRSLWQGRKGCTVYFIIVSHYAWYFCLLFP